MTDGKNPFAPRQRSAVKDVIARIKTWLRASMPIDDEDAISVTELACAEAGCSPRETIIVVMPERGSWTKVRIHKDMRDVTEDDICWALRSSETISRPS